MDRDENKYKTFMLLILSYSYSAMILSVSNQKYQIESRVASVYSCQLFSVDKSGKKCDQFVNNNRSLQNIKKSS